MPAGHATVTGATANMTMIDQLTEHDRIELLARAQDAWDRAPQNTMRAVFEWRGKNYVVSHSSFQLRIHSEEGIKVCWTHGCRFHSTDEQRIVSTNLERIERLAHELMSREELSSAAEILDIIEGRPPA
jgi:hypothetical protein